MSATTAIPKTDKSLLKSMRELTNKHAWKQFVDLYSPLVFGFCRRSSLNEADACDVTQNVFLQVMKGITCFEYDPALGTFRGWLGTIILREISRLTHRSHLQHEFAGLGDIAGSVSAEWTDAFNAHVLSTALLHVRDEFDEESWTAFEQTWKLKIPTQTVAEQLKRPVSWVYKARFRILHRLREQVQALADDCSFIGDN